MVYPEKVFTDKGRGYRWLKSIPEEELRTFVKDYLERGSRFPFETLSKDYSLPSDSLFFLIDSFNDKELEREIGEVTEELLGDVSPEEDKEYFYNLINAATDFNYRSNREGIFEKLYEYAKNKDLAGEKVYGQDLYRSILGCLFSFRVPKEYEDEVIELCEENIEEGIFPSLCYRNAWEIESSKAITLMNNYLEAEENDMFLTSTIERFLSNRESKKVFENNMSIFVDEVIPKIEEMNKTKEFSKIGIDIDYDPKKVHIKTDRYEINYEE